MCGIGGIAVNHRCESINVDTVQKIELAIQHRGPDDGESWVAPGGRVGFAHRRLAILDLSPSGHQPMHTPDGRYTIAFNGEIYNFRNTRKELESRGVCFRSSGDTEVVLQAFVQFGPDSLRRLDGMFVFAVWDRDEQELFLARDPMGIKPLYVWDLGDRIAFASEVRALLASGLGPRRLDCQALTEYLTTGSVPEPNTLVEGITMLPAGSWLRWKQGISQRARYWKIEFPTPSSSTAIADEEATSLTRTALQDSIARHFVSDVPVGIFLSGGIDSTAIVALARQSGIQHRIKTFSIAFDDPEFDEGDLAAQTAAHFETEHHQWRMKPEEGCQLFDRFLAAMDQPSNDGFNTFCVSKFAHDEGMKVVLSGLGGDEVFAGYPSFEKIPQLLAWHHRLWPLGPARHWLANGLRGMWSTGPRARLADFIDSNGDTEAGYRTMRGCFAMHEAKRLVDHYAGRPYQYPTPAADKDLAPDWHVRDKISYLELTRYMRNQLLRDSDVMSMAWGLELRVPFVDRPLMDAVSQITSRTRLAQGKQLLVKATKTIPDWVLQQPKRGFRFPFQKWLASDASWTDRFRQTLDRSPVKPKTWYQQWMLVVLEKALAGI